MHTIHHVILVLKYPLKTVEIGMQGNHAMPSGGDRQEQDGGLCYHVL